MSEGVWTVRLSAAAEADYVQILRWTASNFGTVRAQSYAETLSTALKALNAGPAIVGVKRRPEIGNNIHTLHVARNRRKGRHIVMFRVAGGQGADLIDVLRLLPDSMDLQRHLPQSEHG